MPKVMLHAKYSKRMVWLYDWDSLGVHTMKLLLIGLTAISAAFALVPSRASAVTITLTNDGPVSPNTGGVLLGPGVFETSSHNAPHSIGANASDPKGWDPWGASDTNSRWLSVGSCCGGTGSFATFSFAAPEDTLSLLWGSPNSDNTVTLYSGKNGKGTVIGTVSFVDGVGYEINGSPTTTPYGPNTTAPGDIISISSSSLFQSAVLTNDSGGFEVADIRAAAPLPSTWIMLFSALIGLGFFAYRGSRNAAAIAAI
jgi:hypothetical protein